MKQIVIAILLVVVIGGGAVGVYIYQSKKHAAEEAKRMQQIDNDINETLKLFKPDTESRLDFSREALRKNKEKKTDTSDQ